MNLDFGEVDSLTFDQFRIYTGLFNYLIISAFWMCLGPDFIKNVSDTDFWTFGFYIRGVQRGILSRLQDISTFNIPLDLNLVLKEVFF